MNYHMIRCLGVYLFLLSPHAQAQQIPDKAIDISPLLVGEKAPKALLRSSSGELDSLHGVLSKRPTVLIFYRGGWCPYCNTQLAELQGIEKDIVSLGYQIVAVSPDSPEDLGGTVEKNSLNYHLYSDADMHLGQAFGIAFRVPEAASRERLKKSSGGLNPGQLPVPSVFVLNQQGEILFEYINPDYKKRIKGTLLLAVLKTLL